MINSTGPIPVHLWGRLSAVEIMLPYDDDATVDVDLEMNKQNYNARKMFDMAEEFYVSLNLSKLPDDFYQNSIIEKTIDRENLLCFPQTFENLDGKFHVSMCTQIKFKDFLTIHHELGHIQYYQQYHHQPLVFREAANPGFNEAIGGFITLAVATPKHLKKVGLLQDNFLFDDKSQINYLMQNALMKFIDLPTVYAISMFQFGIFRGEIISKNANTKYWEMHRKYGGVVPPAPRTNEDFDAGGIYHVANDVENLRYFVAGILQFQLYKSACIKANEYEPGNPEKLLHNCDFHGNTDVGNSLK